MKNNFMHRLAHVLTGGRTAKVRSWVCPICGGTHDDLPVAMTNAPLIWDQASEQERRNDFILTDETCVWKDEHYFVRGALEVPIIGRDEVLAFGVWTSLSRENYFRYIETLTDMAQRERVELPPMFGWFANSLPGYPETLNLKCMVHARSSGLRPLIELDQADHPFSIDQRQGITFTHAVDYVHAHLEG